MEQKDSFLKTYSLELAVLISALLVASTLFVTVGGLTNAIAAGAVLAPAGAGSGAGSGSGSAGSAGAPSTELQIKSINLADLKLETVASKGASSPKVTVVEFSDFQCPFCKRAFPEVKNLLSSNPDSVKLYLRHHALTELGHLAAPKASEAFECARDQNKQWEMHDRMFTDGNGDGSGLAVADLKKYAQELGLNTATFNTCLDSGAKEAMVSEQKSVNSAKYGVRGTPSFMLIGGKVSKLTQSQKDTLGLFVNTLKEQLGDPSGADAFQTSDGTLVIFFAGALPYSMYKPIVDIQKAAN